MGISQKDGRGKPGYDELAGQQSPQISLYAEPWDGEEDACNTDKQSGDIDQESEKCLSQAIDGAYQGGVSI